jgi:hypothetical protein
MAKYDRVILAFDNPSLDEDGYKTTRNVGGLLLPRMGPNRVFVARYIHDHKDAADMIQKGDKEALDTLLNPDLAAPFDILELE